MPMTFGFSFGPRSESQLRPFVEAGGGYYRLDSTTSRIVTIVPASSAYETVRGQRPPSIPNRLGGYLGVGVDVPLTHRIDLGTGVRIHAWSEPDALIALQSGLSFGF
jgi:hypothetical protein